MHLRCRFDAVWMWFRCGFAAGWLCLPFIFRASPLPRGVTLTTALGAGKQGCRARRKCAAQECPTTPSRKQQTTEDDKSVHEASPIQALHRAVVIVYART